MRMKPFGRTGLSVSEYGLGTWAMGGGIYGTVEDAESIRTIHRAEDLGVNFIDTAPMYGMSETADGRAESIVGQALAGRRDRWVIATKFGRHLRPAADGGCEIHEDYSPARAVASLEDSLRRLRTDRVDVFFVHTPTPDPELFRPEETFAAMERLREQGKIRVVGFSFHVKAGSWLAAVEPFLRSGLCQAVQVGVSLLEPEPLGNLFPVAREAGTAVVAREALAQGFLTDSFTAEGPFDEQDYKSRMTREQRQARLDQAGRFRLLVDPARGVPGLPAAALHWVVSNSEVSCVIPGAKTIPELEQCLAAADAEPFDPATMGQVVAIHEEWG
jgi:aryl-alcohol dehydrogenase-like predicted oxidoreductase